MPNWIEKEREKWESSVMETMFTMWLGKKRETKTRRIKEIKTKRIMTKEISKYNHMLNLVSLEYWQKVKLIL